jgi:hypothetical protein
MGKILWWLGPESKTFGSAQMQIEVSQSTDILTLPRHRFFLRYGSELAVKYKVSLSSGKLRFRTAPLPEKVPVFRGVTVEIVRGTLRFVVE